jgi:hypothetical protein
VVFLSGLLAGVDEALQPVTLEGCLAFGKPFKVASLRWFLETEMERRSAEGARGEEALLG